jgi:hypothetical protein
MLPQPTSSPQQTDANITRIGVGIDTSRYGHYAAFLREDLQPAAAELQFIESGAGYGQLRQRFEQLAQRHGHVHFVVRLDAAGQYADNLLHFLHALDSRGAHATPLANPAAHTAPLAKATLSISCGDPQRNKNYRVATFGKKKSDPIEARAARYVINEGPAKNKPRASSCRQSRREKLSPRPKHSLPR